MYAARLRLMEPMNAARLRLMEPTNAARLQLSEQESSEWVTPRLKESGVAAAQGVSYDQCRRSGRIPCCVHAATKGVRGAEPKVSGDVTCRKVFWHREDPCGPVGTGRRDRARTSMLGRLTE